MPSYSPRTLALASLLAMAGSLGAPTQPIIIDGNLVRAYGTKIGNMDLSKTEVRRVEF